MFEDVLGSWETGDSPVSARSSLRLVQSPFSVEGVGSRLWERLAKAGAHFLRLRNQMPTLAGSLAKFADLLVRETGGEDEEHGEEPGRCKSLSANGGESWGTTALNLIGAPCCSGR